MTSCINNLYYLAFSTAVNISTVCRRFGDLILWTMFAHPMRYPHVSNFIPAPTQIPGPRETAETRRNIQWSKRPEEADSGPET